MTLQQIIAECGTHLGSYVIADAIPHGVVLPVAYVAEAWARVTGRAPRVTVDGVRLSRKHMYFSSARAAAGAGLPARGPDVACATRRVGSGSMGT